MTIPQHASDGGARPPRLEVFQATWAMLGLPGARAPFDLGEAVAWVRDAGFTGMMHWVETEADFAAIEVIRRAGLLAGIGFPVRDPAIVPLVAQNARGLGVNFLNAQVYDAFASDAEALARLTALYEVCDAAGVPLFIETHRGMITQDLLRTVAYARQAPRVRFTLDASHYVVAGEITQPDQAPRFNAALAEIIARSASLHARVSNGEQVQVDIGNGSSALVQPYIAWWTAAYRQWLARAAAGEFFPFVCELGPAPYAIMVPGSAGVEISDRFAQALVFKSLAEQIRDHTKQ